MDNGLREGLGSERGRWRGGGEQEEDWEGCGTEFVRLKETEI